MHPLSTVCRTLLAGALLALIVARPVGADEWPQFRGPGASGVADGQGLPDEWDAEAGENVRWKTPIPGLGHACPVVSRGRVFIVTADNGQEEPELRLGLYGDIAPVWDDSQHTWELYCLAQRTGEVLWRRTLHQGVPAIKRHTKATHANATPATDGRRIVVFLGSEGLHCLDYSGELLWKKDLGVLDSGYFEVPQAQWEFASSPIIHDGKVFVQCDVQEDSFLAAFDLADGRELWRAPRDDVPTWSTPAIVPGEDRTELIVNGFRHTGGYDAHTGEPLWQVGGGGDIPVPTPVFADGLIFFSSAHGRSRPLMAVRPGASGELDLEADAADDREAPADTPEWRLPGEGIYLQTPIVYRGLLYACRNNGLLSCYQASTGERLYRKRLGSGRAGFTASPVAADGKLYFTREDGTTYVVGAGPEFELLAENELGESCMATPAIADGLLLIRSTRHVFAIGDPALTVADAGGPPAVEPEAAERSIVIVEPPPRAATPPPTLRPPCRRLFCKRACVRIRCCCPVRSFFLRRAAR